MTVVDPGWRELFAAVGKVPGPQRERAIQDMADRISLATANTLRRTISDVAVSHGAVDTGEGFDPWSYLADWASDKEAMQAGIIAKLFPGSGTGADGVTQAMGVAAQTLLGLSQDVQALQEANSTGKSYVINYADYPDGESEAVGVPFDLDYTGTGSGRSWIAGGVSGWNKVVNGDVQVIGRYNDGSANIITDTDYQLLQATAVGPMDVGAREAFCPRMSADKQSYLYIEGYRPSTFSFKCELGCYVAGVKTVFATNVPAGFSLNLSMKTGDIEGADPYRFQVFSGNSLIIDYTDHAEVSELGPLFRGWGFTASTGNGGNAIPASASRVQCSDMAA